VHEARPTIATIHRLIDRRDVPYPSTPWWRRHNTAREIAIGEHMYVMGARRVLREWEAHENTRKPAIYP
jgi:hypothetical protein